MRPEQKRKLLSRFALAMRERRRLCAYYSYNSNQLRNLVRRYRFSFRGYNAFLTNLESQLHIIVWRTGFFRNPSLTKAFIKAGNIYINHNRVNSIGYCCQLYDFIFFGNFSFNVFMSKIKRTIRFYDSHLLINFRLPSIFYYKPPDPTKLFYYFPINHRYAFFTWRFRRR